MSDKLQFVARIPNIQGFLRKTPAHALPPLSDKLKFVGHSATSSNFPATNQRISNLAQEVLPARVLPSKRLNLPIYGFNLFGGGVYEDAYLRDQDSYVRNADRRSPVACRGASAKEERDPSPTVRTAG
jgi:hypothetical protein